MAQASYGPYSGVTDLPDAVQKHLTGHAQKIFLAVFNSVLGATGDSTRAFKSAWSKVHKNYGNPGNKTWVKRKPFKYEQKDKSMSEYGEIFALVKAKKAPVSHPGSRGGRGYYEGAVWHYGEKPKGRKRVATGIMSEGGTFTDDAQVANQRLMADKVLEAKNTAFSKAKTKKRDMGGIEHYVIEHGWLSGDKDNPAAGRTSYSVVQHDDAYDSMLGFQQQGQGTLGVYTSRGRKLSPAEVQGLTSRRNAEIDRFSEMAKKEANAKGEAYGVMEITPKSGRTMWNIFPISAKNQIVTSTRAKFPDFSLRQVASIKPETIAKPVPSKAAPRKTRSTKGSKYRMVDYDYEQMADKYVGKEKSMSSLEQLANSLTKSEEHRRKHHPHHTRPCAVCAGMGYHWLASSERHEDGHDSADHHGDDGGFSAASGSAVTGDAGTPMAMSEAEVSPEVSLVKSGRECSFCKSSFGEGALFTKLPDSGYCDECLGVSRRA